jgi:hypothetical protein
VWSESAGVLTPRLLQLLQAQQELEKLLFFHSDILFFFSFNGTGG